METVQAPSRAELVSRASELVPLLREHTAWTEEHRRLSDEAIQAVTDAGILKMRAPARYGGYESDMRTLVAVLTELGRGDASVSWTVSVWSICSWLVGLFPDAVQDEVFATPDVRVCGLLSPSGTAVAKDGGYVVNGRWAFNTGSLQSHWNSLVAMLTMPDGTQQPVMALVPVSDLKIIDDWYTTGLRGTGSVTTVATELFVPAERMLPMGPVMHEQYASVLNAGSPIYQTPMLLTAATSTVGTVLGLGAAAKEAFFERLPGRKITYTEYARQSEAPLTHLQIADATVRIDEAEFHAYRAASLLDEKGATGDPWSLEERAGVRADIGAACQRTKEAINIMSTASGASSIYSDVPIQRIERDMQALSLHAILHPNTNLELYGRILCGMPPNTMYL